MVSRIGSTNRGAPGSSRAQLNITKATPTGKTQHKRFRSHANLDAFNKAMVAGAGGGWVVHANSAE